MILRISFFLLLIIAFLTWHVYRKNCSKYLWSKYLHTLLVFLFFFTTLFLAFNDDYVYKHPHIVGVYLTLFLGWAIPYLLWILLGFVQSKINEHHRSYFLWLRIFFTVFTEGVILYGFFYGYQIINCNKITVSSSFVPKAFDGYKIVHISDLHLSSFKNHPLVLNNIIDSIQSLRPDLIVFTGDLITNQSHEIDSFIPTLKKMHAPAGVLSVLGNHDEGFYMKWKTEKERLNDVARLKRMEESLGWQLLEDTTIFIHNNKDSLSFVGVNYYKKDFFTQKSLIRSTHTHRKSRNNFTIFLLHDPKSWDKCVHSCPDIRLTLSGHTHGFQMSFLGLSPAIFFFRYSSGLYKDKKNHTIYVNTGLGEALLPIRINVWPEITLITLKSKR